MALQDAVGARGDLGVQLASAAPYALAPLPRAVLRGEGGLDHHREDGARVTGAVAEADATALVAQLPQGLDTLLGIEAGGVELSEGQWQKIALARSCMRREPLLFLLDEPTASLEAPSEQAIFTHCSRRSRAGVDPAAAGVRPGAAAAGPRAEGVLIVRPAPW